MPAKEKKRKSGGTTNGRKVLPGIKNTLVSLKPCFQVNKVRKKHANSSPGDVEVSTIFNHLAIIVIESV